ncbi:transposase [Vannielia litorea]|uniref:REP-associated tyrosine transposase n=1 Tax=Vannielia litorea TaxID=1217970 RepID=UPI001C98D024|nr:transposase [Vannielia litorea]MBY6154232.1 transposase [Vannielia litorea]
MSAYSRPRTPNAPVFFTVRLAQRGSTLLIDGLDVLRAAVAHVKSYRPFDILAFVVLPDHLHAVLRFPEDDPNYSQRWGSIKARFSRDVRRAGLVPPWPVADAEAQRGLFRKGEAGLWQKRFREHHCGDAAEVEAQVRYCWADPVKHGLVQRATDWEASSIHREVRLGRVQPDWSAAFLKVNLGEAA